MGISANDIANLPGYPVSVLETAAFRHINGDIEGVGVVFRQHLEFDLVIDWQQEDSQQQCRQLPAGTGVCSEVLPPAF